MLLLVRLVKLNSPSVSVEPKKSLLSTLLVLGLEAVGVLLVYLIDSA